MSKFFLSQKANKDIEDVFYYIAKENPVAAKETIQKLFSTFKFLSENPGIGHSREDLTKRNLRFFTVKKHYMVVYKQFDNKIEITRVISSYRNVGKVL